MTYHIGQILDPSPRQAEPFGAEMRMAWVCVHPKPSPKAHQLGRAFFREANFSVFYPSKERAVKGKGDRKRDAVEVPILPGYLFVQMQREPHWHVIKREKWFAGVFKIGETVIEFPYVVIRHLQGMTVDAERLARANAELQRQMIEAAMPVAGQQACFVAGPFAGQVVTVESVTGQLAHFEMMGKRIAADAISLRRV